MNYKKIIQLSIFSAFLIIIPLRANEILNNTTINGKVDYNFEASRVNAKNSKLSEIDLSIGSKTKIDDFNNLIIKGSYESDYYNKISPKNSDDFYLENLYIESKQNFIDTQVGRVNIEGPLVDSAYANGLNSKFKISDTFKINASLYKNTFIKDLKDQALVQVQFYKKLNNINISYLHAFVRDSISTYSISAEIKNDITRFYAIHTQARYKKVSPLLNTPTMTKAYLDINYAYTKTRFSLGWSGDEANYVTLDKNSDAEANYRLWQLDLKEKADSTVFGLDITVRVLPRFDLRGAIVGGKVQNFKDAVEHLGEAKYTYNKNLIFSLKASRYKESAFTEDTIPIKYYTRYYKSAFEINYKF